MKRVISILLAVMLVATLASCAVSDEAEKDRFENKYVGEYKTIIIDQDTGVMYLFVKSGYGGGLSVMLDRDGKPLVHSE